MVQSVESYKGSPNLRMIQLMNSKGYNLHTLAEVSTVSEKTLWSMLKGRSYPRLDTILLVCYSLNCTIDYLYPTNYN